MSRGSGSRRTRPSERSRDPAVLPDPPEVHGQEDGYHERKRQDMENVPPEEGLSAHLAPSQEDELDLPGHERRVRPEARADREGPERQLVPRQQVAAEGQQQGD